MPTRRGNSSGVQELQEIEDRRRDGRGAISYDDVLNAHLLLEKMPSRVLFRVLSFYLDEAPAA